MLIHSFKGIFISGLLISLGSNTIDFEHILSRPICFFFSKSCSSASRGNKKALKSSKYISAGSSNSNENLKHATKWKKKRVTITWMTFGIEKVTEANL